VAFSVCCSCLIVFGTDSLLCTEFCSVLVELSVADGVVLELDVAAGRLARLA